MNTTHDPPATDSALGSNAPKTVNWGIISPG